MTQKRTFHRTLPPLFRAAGRPLARKNLTSAFFLSLAVMAATPALAAGVGTADGMSGVGFSGSGVNVQVNIDNSKVIDSSRNVSINKTFNGVNVGYGLGGASVLGIINQRSADAQAITDQRSTQASQAASQAQYIAQIVSAYGGY